MCCGSTVGANGVGKCSNNACVDACAPNYLLCNASRTCGSALWGFEDPPMHVPWTCGPYGARQVGTPTPHSGSTALELQGTGTPYGECYTFENLNCSSGLFDNLAGATASIWVRAPSWDSGYSPSCWLYTDAGKTATRSLTVKDAWTQLSWVFPASLSSSAQMQVYCDLPDAEYFYIDDFTITPK